MRYNNRILFCLILFTVGFIGTTRGSTNSLKPIRYSFQFDEKEREYFVWLPDKYEMDKTYWMLVIAHGGGNINSGRRFWMTKPIWRYAQEKGLEAIIVTPTFHKPDPIPERYPIREGQFLSEIIDRIKNDCKVFPKILLTGYSRGGQFSHRYAFWYPEKVQACAPFAAGSWTTPDGRLLDPVLGEIENPKMYLSSISNKNDLPEKMRDPRVAELGGKPALPVSKEIPFLVMCGSLDERIEIAKMFAQSLKLAGYSVEKNWPRTPHGGKNDPKYRDEFEKFTQGAVEFFQRKTIATPGDSKE